MTRLRIGYTCHDAFPSTDTNTQQIFWTLIEVARLGVSVHLLVPGLRVDGDARTAIARHYGASEATLPDTFTIAALGKTAPPTTWSRGWFDWTVARHLETRAIDLAWTRDLLAAASTVRAKLPTVFETYRPDVATAPAFAPWRAMTLKKPALLGTIAHSRLTRDAFIAAGVPGDRVLLAHNGYAPSLMTPELSREEARARLSLPYDRPLVVYTGHVGPKKGIDAVVRLAARLPEATFVIVGVDQQSSERQSIDALAHAHGARNLLLVPRVPLAAVSGYLYAADVLIVPPTDEPLKRFRRTVLPMKLFSYLAAGRPIVAPDLDDTKEVLEDGVNACLVSATDLPSAAARVQRLLGDRAPQDRLSSGARESAGGLTWAARAQRIVPFLESVLSARNGDRSAVQGPSRRVSSPSGR